MTRLRIGAASCRGRIPAQNALNIATVVIATADIFETKAIAET
jgi:hypothetical protein